MTSYPELLAGKLANLFGPKRSSLRRNVMAFASGLLVSRITKAMHLDDSLVMIILAVALLAAVAVHYWPKHKPEVDPKSRLRITPDK